MLKIPSKSFIAALTILVSSLVLSIYGLLPLIGWLSDMMAVVEPALRETTPTIILKDGGIEFEGEIPYQVELQTGQTVFFDSSINDSLFEAAAVHSIFLAEKEIWIKTRDDIKKIQLDGMEIDGDKEHKIYPLIVKEKLARFKFIIFFAIAFAVVLLSLLFFFLLIHFVAGIGIMIDAFSNGPHSFKELLNVSGILTIFLLIVWIIFNQGTFRYITLFVVVLFVLMIAFVSLNTYLAARASDHISDHC